MAEKPILFNTEMVKAILDGRKRVTRRIAFPNEDLRPFPRKEYPHGWWYRGRAFENWDSFIGSRYEYPPCKYQPGDILWVRETWKQATTGTAGPGLIDLFLYKADEPQNTDGMMVEGRWHPSIHMPRRAARLFLKVEKVFLRRLQDMTTTAAELEGSETDEWFELCEEAGVVGLPTWSLREFFGYHIWNRTISREENLARYGWDANPWVWVIEFERLDGKPAGLWADRNTAQWADQDVLMPAT